MVHVWCDSADQEKEEGGESEEAKLWAKKQKHYHNEQQPDCDMLIKPRHV